MPDQQPLGTPRPPRRDGQSQSRQAKRPRRLSLAPLSPKRIVLSSSVSFVQFQPIMDDIRVLCAPCVHEQFHIAFPAALASNEPAEPQAGIVCVRDEIAARDYYETARIGIRIHDERVRHVRHRNVALFIRGHRRRLLAASAQEAEE